MAIFNSYAKLPKGNQYPTLSIPRRRWDQPLSKCPNGRPCLKWPTENASSECRCSGRNSQSPAIMAIMAMTFFWPWSPPFQHPQNHQTKTEQDLWHQQNRGRKSTSFPPLSYQNIQGFLYRLAPWQWLSLESHLRCPCGTWVPRQMCQCIKHGQPQPGCSMGKCIDPNISYAVPEYTVCIFPISVWSSCPRQCMFGVNLNSVPEACVRVLYQILELCASTPPKPLKPSLWWFYDCKRHYVKMWNPIPASGSNMILLVL